MRARRRILARLRVQADREAPRGHGLIQIDAAPERIGLARAGARARRRRKADPRGSCSSGSSRASRGDGAGTGARRPRRPSSARSPEQRNLAVELLETIERALPEGAAAAWDSTILAYTACWYLRVAEPQRFLYPAGSSTLGYALPAALGAAAALPERQVLAVAGDGGFQYGIAELATAKQHDLDVALLVIDDRGYGILRQYQDDAGFAHTGRRPRAPGLRRALPSLRRPRAPQLAAARSRTISRGLSGSRGPAVVVLEEVADHAASRARVLKPRLPFARRWS